MSDRTRGRQAQAKRVPGGKLECVLFGGGGKDSGGGNAVTFTVAYPRLTTPRANTVADSSVQAGTIIRATVMTRYLRKTKVEVTKTKAKVKNNIEHRWFSVRAGAPVKHYAEAQGDPDAGETEGTAEVPTSYHKTGVRSTTVRLTDIILGGGHA